ncbi:tape measure protein [Tomitella gaofuii]|uniref:tape measure protein n=1 Tax=Tomitella gaofuii TaxID=2760083 RepID=UPI0015F7B809|nr:tape measure protein [Tomitella gaofuii]
MGSVSIEVDLDASDLSTAMTKAVQGAMNDMLGTVRAGMGKIETALHVDGSGFADVARDASSAMGAAERTVSSSMANVQKSVSSVDSKGFSDISKAASSAGQTASSSIGEAAGNASAAIDGISTTGLSNVSTAASNAATSVSKVGSAASQSRDALGRFTSAGSQTSEQLGDIGKKAGGAGTAAMGMGGMMKTGLLRAAGGIGAAIGGFQLLSSAVKNASDVSATEASLTGLYDSASDAADMMARINTIAGGSSIEAGAYRDMAQSLGYLGVKGEQSENIMRNLGKVIVGAGGDSSSFDTVSSALTNMQNQGKVTQETLAQLSGAGVPILDALATKLGKEVPEVLKMATDGALDVNDVLGVLEDGTGKWMGQLIEAGDAVDNTFGARWSRAKDQVMESLGRMILPLMEAIGPAVSWAGDALSGLFSALSGAGDAAGPVGEAFGWIKDQAVALWATVGPVFSEWWTMITTELVPTLTAFWNDTVWPIFTQIGQIIGQVWTGTIQPVLATFITVLVERVMPTLKNLWTTVILPVFTQIGNLIKAVWDGILGPIFRLLANILQNVVAPVVMWLWQTVIGPAFTAIGNIIKVAWTIISPIFSVLIAVIRNIGTVMSWLWTSVVVPAWNGIATAISFVWNTLLVPVFNAIRTAINVLGTVFNWLWHNIIEPVWNGISNTITWVWNTLILPIWEAMKWELQGLGDFFGWIWNNIISPAWNALGDGIRWVVDHVVQPAWDALMTGLDFVKDGFSTAVDFIGRMWDGIKKIVATPINFVIGTVYNDGIRWVWNKVAGWLDLPELPEAPLIPGYATGGIYPGYTPGQDIGYIGVSGGEAIMRPEWTRAVGPGYINAANDAARTGGVSGVNRFLGGYDLGGIVSTVWGGVTNIAGKAVDLAKAGYKAAVGGVFDAVIDPIGRAIPDFGGGAIGSLPKAAFQSLADGVKDFLLGKAGDKDAESHVDYDPNGGAEQWRPVVERALEITGHSLDNVNRVLQQINIESSGNPNAINLDDINAQNGTPSQGLLQTIQPTFDAYRDPNIPGGITDPLANIVAGIRYADATYGDIANIWPKTLGYATGGLAVGPGTGTSDDILARISNGEFVVNAQATQANLPLLQALNAGWVPPAALLHEMLPGYATGGLVNVKDLVNFARGVEGQPYDWGGVQWGDCSGAVSALARYANGLDPWGGRFATGNAREALTGLGFVDGVGPDGSLSVGWFNGGPWGGHMAATLPDGTHFEMGGVRGDGQFGGGAAGADDGQFTDHMHLGPDFFLGGNPPADEVSSALSDASVQGASAASRAAGAASGMGMGAYGGGTSGGGAAGIGGTTTTTGTGGGVVGAIDNQTGVIAGIAGDQKKTWDDYHKEQMEALRDQVDAWSQDNIRIPVRDALTGVLGSQAADRFAMVLASGIGETVAGLVNEVQDKLVSAITSIVTDLVTNLADGMLDAAFGTRDESKYGDPIMQALMKTVGVEMEALDLMYASKDSLDQLVTDRDKAFTQAGQIISDNSQIIQRNTSSRERVEAERDLAMQKLVEGTVRTVITKIVIPIITAVLSALITAAFTALGAAIGSIIPGIGTAIGAAIGGSIGAGISAATAGMMGNAIGGMFDEGGVAVGTGLMPKNTIAPERVLSPRQTQSFDRLVTALEGGGRRTTVKAPITMYGNHAPARVQSHLLDLID